MSEILPALIQTSQIAGFGYRQYIFAASRKRKDSIRLRENSGKEQEQIKNRL
jgi:hypothetical protein